MVLRAWQLARQHGLYDPRFKLEGSLKGHRLSSFDECNEFGDTWFVFAGCGRDLRGVDKNAFNTAGTELRAQRARSETKKPEQQEQNAESAPNEERNEELSGKELDQVAGGGISLNFTKIEVT